MATHPPSSPTHDRDPLFSPALQRVGAATGLLAVALIVASFVMSGDTPDFDAPAQEWATYYADDQDKIQVSALLLAVAGVALTWFFAILRGELGRIELAARGFTRLSHAVLAGGVLAVTGLVVGTSLEAGVASLAADTDPEIFRALGNALGAVWMLAIVGFVVLLTATSLLILASRALPVWIAGIGLLSAVAWFALLFFVLDPNNDDSALGIAWPIGFLAFLIWLAALSVTFLRRVGREPEPAVHR
jgi:hypothetical protein